MILLASPLILVSALLLGVAALLGCVQHRAARTISGLLAACGSAVLLVPGAELLFSGGGDTFRGAALIAVSVAATLGAVHGISYARSWTGFASITLGVAFPVFVGAMAVVLLASDIVVFLIAWEFMTVASALMVGVDHHEPANREALVWYLSIGHVTPALLMLIVVVVQPASTSFSGLASAAAHLPPASRGLVFLLALIAGGAKAGLVPLQGWLPRAHPAAPSHVSAVMSGAMVVMGAWLFVLLAVLTLGAGPAWWAWTGIVAGTVSAFMGALYALATADLKRMLAYSTVENMGLLFLELSLWMLGSATGNPELASLALAAAVVHVIAHAIAKSTLFLGAGSFIHLAGTRVLNRMGGLHEAEPALTYGFLAAAASAAALPPLLGFSGEWLLVRAIVLAANRASGASTLGHAVVLGIVALTGGIAMATYAKTVGVGLLGKRRNDEGELGHVGASERIAVIAGATMAFGTPLVVLAASAFSSGMVRTAFASDLISAVRMPAFITIGLTVLVVALILLTRGSVLRVRKTCPWVCGLSFVTPRMQYTSDSFSQPLSRVFAAVLRPSVAYDVEAHAQTPHVSHDAEYERRSQVVFESALYRPMISAVRWLSDLVRRLHNGRVATYMAWMLAAIVALLAYGRWGS